jgi:sulfatase modifying factor 1
MRFEAEKGRIVAVFSAISVIAGGAACGGSSTGAASGSASSEPSSCAKAGPGRTNCGQAMESCCSSPVVAGGTYDRTYSADSGTDPATVSTFHLDKYDVTVGRFRQFVAVALPPDGSAGWRPAAGSGKHAYLSSGKGLANVGPTDAGVAFETGWVAADDGNVAPTATNLACSSLGTWTAAPGSQESSPINCVNWWEAAAFCIWDGGFLPSEAEWEYAAAGGSQQRPYPWGSTDPGTANQYAIYNCNYPTAAEDCVDLSSIAPVGTPVSGAGLWGQLDLGGEMSEWTADWFRPAYVDPCTDCASLTGGSSRSLRGGSFRDAVSNLAPAYRDANDPSLRNDFIGFRCARSGGN